MLTTTILALLAVPQQDPPPSTSVLMDMPLAVMGQTLTSDLMYSEIDTPSTMLSEADGRMVIREIAPNLPSHLRIGSFSRGTGAFYTLMHDQGHVYPQVAMDGWSFLLVSVSGSGWVPGSAFRAEADAPGGNVNGDVFAHILGGSEAWFPDVQVGQVHKLRDGDDLGVTPMADFDSFLSGYAATDDYVAEADAEMGAGVKFYFTIKQVGLTGSYDDIPSGWGPQGTSWKRPSTIFVAEHDGTAWTGPQIWKDANELGIDVWSEISAMSVMDPNFMGTMAAGTAARGAEVLLSTRDPDMARKLWIVGSWTHPSSGFMRFSGALSTEGGANFAEQKLRITNPTQQFLEGMCGDDPGDDGGSSVHHRLRRERTALVDGYSSGNPNLDFSLHQLRQLPNVAGTRFRATLQGFVTGNDVYAKLMIDSSKATGMVAYVMRTGIQTDKQHRNIVIPFVGKDGETVTLHWEVFGSAGQLVGVSQDIEVRVR